MSTSASAVLAAIVRPAEYERLRPAYLRRMVELRRRRRMRLGPNVVVLFESQETVLAQLHEQLRAGGDWRHARVLGELEGLRALLPRPGELAATLMIDGGTREEGECLNAALRSRAPAVMLEAGCGATAGLVLDDSPEPGCPIHFLRFSVGQQGAAALQNPAVPVNLRLDAGGLALSEPLRLETRAELAADLAGPPASSLLAELSAWTAPTSATGRRPVAFTI